MKKVLMKNKPTFLFNDSFKSIIIKVMFPYTETEDTLAYQELLPCLLDYMNNKYPSEEEFVKEKKRLYILSTSCGRTALGNNGFFTFHLVIPDTYALEKDLLEEQIIFFKNIIYNPLIKDNGFSEFELEREKKNLTIAMDNCMKNIKPYHSFKVRKLIDDQGILSRDLINHRDLIDKVTPNNLYNYYLDNIKNNQPIVYVMGNVDEKKITDLCSKHLFEKKYDDKEIEIETDYFLKPRKTINTVEENSNFKDSSFSIIYKVRDMVEEDGIYLGVLKSLLTSLSSRLLSQRLRVENELIYSSKVISYPHYGAFEITNFIDKNNKDKLEEEVYKLIDDFKDIELITPLLENIKERNKLNLLRQLDDKYFIFDDFVISDLGIDDTVKEYYEKIDKVTAEDIASFVDRLVLDTVYFLKEGENE